MFGLKDEELKQIKLFLKKAILTTLLFLAQGQKVIIKQEVM